MSARQTACPTTPCSTKEKIMIQPGRHYTLTLIDITGTGAYLDAGELGRVLLPKRYVPAGAKVNDGIDVFLYRDSEDRLVATTRSPLASAGQFARLKVVEVNQVGAFLDWGLEKDLLVPFSEQKIPMEAGRSYLVYVGVDKIHGRLFASSKLDRYLNKEGSAHQFKPGQAVDLIIAKSTDLGYKTIIDHSHWGVLYRTEVFQRLSVGQQVQGFIKHIRPDGKIDLSLQAGGETLERQARKLVQYLQAHEGYAPLHDKTDSHVISGELNMSKAAFKKCTGRLYREGTIAIEEGGIRLLDADRSGKKPVVTAGRESVPTSSVWAGKSGKARNVAVSRVPVELYKILKFEGLVNSGAEAKAAIAEGKVSVNGAVETRKRRQIINGDIIQFGREKLCIVHDTNALSDSTP